MTAAALYTQTVLNHHRAPRNFGALDGHSHAADGANPLCGDTLRVELTCNGDRVRTMRFRGEACAIAIAAASMLSELVVGKSPAEIARIETAFARLVGGEIAHDEALAELNAMRELARYPTRRKCALLAFATLRAALAGEASATTEGDGKL
jgi:nitrogen fixation NifU-like protein